ncbi:MAG: hypothetical protein OXI11_04675, partial [Gammaproteobacteria bacterium]|nr:hypothetical protein [Gammaproteobacteria bacterium]
MMTKLHTQRREEQAIDRGIFRARGTRLIRAQVGSTRGISAALALTFVTAIAAPIVEAGTISASRTQIVEAGGITTVTITPLISVDGEGLPVSISAVVGGGTAEAGVDFVVTALEGVASPPSNGSVRLVSHFSKARITARITAVSDSADEPNETIPISAESSESSDNFNNITVTITDDDPAPKVSVSSSETVVEGAGNVSLTVSLSKESGKKVTVDYATSNGTAVAGQDYRAKSGTLTFDPGDEPKKISVSIIDDSVSESDENFKVRLSNPSNATLGSAASSTVTIRDNDLPDVTVSYASATYEATEGGASATVTVKLSAEPKRQVNIPIVVTHKAGASNSDHSGIPAKLTFGDNDTTRTFTVTATDDSVNDDGEWLSLSFGNLPAGVKAGSPASERVDLIDNDAPNVTVSYVSANYQATEGGASATVTVNLSAKPERQVRIPIAVTHKAGASSADYSGIPANVMFGGSDTSKTFTVTATDDTVDDDGEWLSLSFGSLPTGVTLGNPGTERVDLIDNDVPNVTVSYVSANYQATEGGASATVTVRLNGRPERRVDIPIRASGGGGADSGDYELSASRVTFSATQTSRSFKVTATDDDVDDDGEWLSLSFGRLPAGVAAGSTATERVDLIDNDVPSVRDVTVSYASADYEATEGGSSATVTVYLSAKPQRQVRIPIVVTGKAGASSADYSGVPPGLTFGSSDTAKTFTLTATDDTVDDDGEWLALSFGSLPPGVTAGGVATERVDLIDDEADPTVTLALSPDSISENGGVSTVTASLSHASSAATTVTVSASPVSPAVSGDFTLSGATLTIAAGSTSSTGTVTITANDNEIDAPDKEVTVSGTASNPQGLQGDPDAVTLTIEDDDDPPAVSLSSSAKTVDEGAGSVTLTARLSAASGRSVTVDYATANGTAKSGADYTAASGTLTFTAGQEEKAILVSITDDAIDEPGETFTVRLSSPSNAALGSPSSSVVTIQDNDVPDVTVSYVSADYNATEGGSSATVTVTLSAAPQRQVTIPIVSSPGGGATAQGQAGADYSGIPASVTFGKTDTSKTFTVTAAD